MGELAKPAEAEGLTSQQQRFVECLLSGGTNAEALKAADYGQTISASWVLRSATVQRALRVGRKAIIRGELGGLAIKTIRELMDAKTPAATRFQAAKFVLEQDADAESEEKQLSEMTPSELEAMIDRLQRERDAGLIDVTPSNGA